MTTQRDGTNTPAGEGRPPTDRPGEQRHAPGPGGRAGMPPARTWLWFALILLANFLIFRFLFPGPEAPVEVPYTVFKEEVRAGNVESVFSQGDTVEGMFKEPVTYPPEGEESSEPDSKPSRTSETFTTALPSFVDPGLEELLIDNGVEIMAEPIEQSRSWLQTLLFGFGPALLLVGLLIWLSRRAGQQGGGMGGTLTGLGRSRARRYDQEKVHTRSVPLAESVDLRELAASTPGLSGADLRNLVNEAALLAARREQDQVAQKDFLDALEKIALGPERPLMMSPDERERIAYHEGGHAILGLVVPGADPVNRVTIVPRGQALGVTYQRPEDDRYNYPEGYLRARIVGALGGRSAEEIVYGTKTTGAENDIEQATDLARRMVTRWGMSEKLGTVQLAPRENAFLGGGYPSEKPFSEETARAIDEEVLRIIDESHKEACRLLTKHRNELDALAQALLEHETLDEEEILEVTSLPPAPSLENTKIPVSSSNSRRDDR